MSKQQIAPAIRRQKTFTIVSKFVSVFIIVAVVFGIFMVSFGIYSNQRKKSKAVIILPGLFASGLYDTETGKGVWDPFESLDIHFGDFLNHTGLSYGMIVDILGDEELQNQLDHIGANNNLGDGKSFLSQMGMNEDGTPMVKTIKPVPFDSDSRLRYGVINAQTDMYNAMEKSYGDTHEVQVFNYDFRLDNRYSAQLLEEYINSKGYKEVILVSHSNGGAVAACYLARSKTNRDKVTLNLSLDAPYYGSFSAIDILENIDGMIEGLVSSLSESSFTAGIANMISTAFESQFKPLVNMWAVYQLLPSYGLLSTQQYYYKWDEEIKGLSGEPTYKSAEIQKSFINIDGEDIFFESAEELWEFYCSRPWAKTSSGQLRVQLTQWLEFQDAMMVTLDDGTKVHSTSLVNSQYFSGMGYRNISKVYYLTDETDTLVQDRETYEYTDQGDGTVLLYSATAGCKESERIHIVPFTNHYDIAQRFNEYSKTAVLSVIDESMDGWDLYLNKIL